MAHNLEIKNGEASFFSVKENAWHGLGKIVDKQLTSREAILAANLDFEVVKKPVLVNIDGVPFESDEMFTTSRTDKTGADAVLGYVGRGYNVYQNTDAFEFFDNIVGANEAFYETAGVLGKGERIFITCTLPDHFNIDLGDKDWVRPYLFLTNSHNGKGAITAAITNTRIVCNNTLSVALKNCTNKITLKHTKNVKAAMSEAHKILKVSDLFNAELKAILPAMANTRINDNDYKRIIASAFTDDSKTLDAFIAGRKEDVSTQIINTVNSILQYDASNDTQKFETTKGTVWGAFNAVTGYFQNVKTYASDSEKVETILDGDIAKKTQKVWNAAYSFIN